MESDEACYDLLLQYADKDAHPEIRSELGANAADLRQSVLELYTPVPFYICLKKFIPVLQARRILKHFGKLDELNAAEEAAQSASSLTSIPSLDPSPLDTLLTTLLP
jgi:hypothetical protein